MADAVRQCVGDTDRAAAWAPATQNKKAAPGVLPDAAAMCRDECRPQEPPFDSIGTQLSAPVPAFLSIVQT